MSVTPTYLIDPNGQQWQLAASDLTGTWTTTPVSPQVGAVNSILLADTVTTKRWRLTVVPNPPPAGYQTGDLRIDASSSSTSKSRIIVNSPLGAYFAITVASNLINTTRITCPSFQVGALYIPNYQGIGWQQIGGIGGKVLPTLGDGPFTAYPVPGQWYGPSGQALWLSGCGHGYDTIQVFRDWDATCQISAALLCCPDCSYINAVIEPYEEIYNYISMPILIP
jgi:hypothetical protein